MRKDLRLHDWDYSCNSCYHVVFCVHGRLMLFGEVERSAAGEYRTALSPVGKLVLSAIEQAEAQYEAVSVELHCIMPNHVHLLVSIIGEDDARTTLGRFVSFVKSSATREARKIVPGLELWQRGYYDHIIRDEDDFARVWEYIENNPANWGDDEYYTG